MQRLCQSGPSSQKDSSILEMPALTQARAVNAIGRIFHLLQNESLISRRCLISLQQIRPMVNCRTIRSFDATCEMSIPPMQPGSRAVTTMNSSPPENARHEVRFVRA
jgi:hypothetical protein